MLCTEFAPAKINLYLHVLGKRADGYHDLESLVIFADIGDEITVEANKTGYLELKVDGEYADALGSPEKNLVYEVVQKVKGTFSIRQGVNITLTKNLPVASGIGGGSSDAAATLRALKQMWQLTDDKKLTEIAMQLGSDVPVCMAPRASLMKGRGEIITPARCELPQYLVLVNPNQLVVTKEIFRRYKASENNVFEANGVKALANTRNDLEDIATSIAPSIKLILEALREQENCLLARMSGSGATCFGLFEKKEDAEFAAEQIKNIHPEWWVKSGKIFDGRQTK